MGYLTDGLTFNTLRSANITRLIDSYKTENGVHANCHDWTPAQWLQALVGEVGEYANLRKKYERGDITEEVFMREATKELADIQTYLDLLANRLKIDLGKATIQKWNEVSERIGSPLRIREDGSDWRVKPITEVEVD